LIQLLKLYILALSETWLSEGDDSVNLSIQNYNFLRSDKVCRCRDNGIALYINSLLTYSEIDLCIPFTNTSINIVGVVVYLRKMRVAVLSAYCPPNTPFSEMHSIELYISSIFYSFDHVICMENFNINLLELHGAYTQLLNIFMSMFSLKQIIDSPTRITQHGFSLLDIILLSNDIVVSESGVRYHRY